ncbi:hypothetical protein Arub01_16430 [Actinomadura rubrobrunea]|uniref:Uncharacterized protein n=1 Tax=Actinomadura rubrobrunea TaxID=115335 RepID=A0A9W6PUP0_9ACTN|nr:hypothetical protein Arub01_16430 [Actinomadura rubrobrunea]
MFVPRLPGAARPVRLLDKLPVRLYADGDHDADDPVRARVTDGRAPLDEIRATADEVVLKRSATCDLCAAPHQVGALTYVGCVPLRRGWPHSIPVWAPRQGLDALRPGLLNVTGSTAGG